MADNGKGLFVTFEGGEGAGKSTLIDRLYDHFSSHKRGVVKTREPGGTPAGEAIRALLLNKGEIALQDRAELLLFLADRAQHVTEVIEPALAQNKIVLCDRYNDSTTAYQGAARGLGEDEVRHLCVFACGGRQPQLTLYLDIDPLIGLSRLKGKKDRIEKETLLFHQKIRAAFYKIAEQEKQRFHILDASKSPDQVFQQALERISVFTSSR